MQKIHLLFIGVLMLGSLYAQQDEPISVHRLEADHYSSLGDKETFFYDSLNHFRPGSVPQLDQDTLQARVFGYHPWWGGSNFLNYRWDLISDLCYFSYEVDPSTGFAETIHDWETSPAIDSALSNGVRVHLCVTLFSGHASFFNNPTAMQNLATEVVALLDSRGAHGVNLDFEAVPVTYSDEMNAFFFGFTDHVKSALPGTEVSIAAPAVNSNSKFDLSFLNGFLDFFMVMAYDYYWTGSSMAGPVSPLYSMTFGYNYSFSRTVSYYQSQDISPEKIIMGVPYYAYQWKTEGPGAPSLALNSGVAYTYRYIHDNATGHYNPDNQKTEENSFAPYFAFNNSGSWYHCFLDNPFSMGKKYDVVLRRGLGGIGIWALGYDNGYDALWELIRSKFTSYGGDVSTDTIFDSGGPAWDYYDEEKYSYTLRTASGTQVYLSFSYLDTEAGYDSLRIYDGQEITSPLIGAYSGDAVPSLIQSSSNSILMVFNSDASTVDAGWRAVYDTVPVSGISRIRRSDLLKVIPNPVAEHCRIEFTGPVRSKECRLIIFDLYGNVRYNSTIKPGQKQAVVRVSKWEYGIYNIILKEDTQIVGSFKMIVVPE